MAILAETRLGSGHHFPGSPGPWPHIGLRGSTDSPVLVLAPFQKRGPVRTTLDSLDMAYTDQGQALPALVFVHGFPLSRDAWQKQVEALAPSHRVIAPDLRGLGESQGSAGATSMARYAEDLALLIRGLGLGPVILAGHSMGGYVALAFADRFPELLCGLVLVGTKAGADTPEGAAKRRATAAKVLAEGTAAIVEDMASKMLAASNHDGAMAQQVRALMAGATPQGLASALLGMADRPDATPRLAQIQVPTLVITGADDTLIPPSESEWLAKGIRGAELEIIPGAGHLVAFEQPEAFNRRLAAWLAQAARPSTSAPGDPKRAL